MAATDLVAERVLETSSTTGTGTYDLAGAAAGYRTFVAALGDGTVAMYFATNSDGSKWELGTGTITDAGTDTLSRTLIASSTGSLIDWQAGDAPYYIYSPASNYLINSMLQQHYGPTRPAWAKRGMIWVDSSGGVTALLLKYFDGADDITLGTINATANTFTVTGLSYASSGEVATGTEAAKVVAPNTLAANVHYQGKQTVWIPAKSWTPRTTNGPAVYSAELSTNKVMQNGLAFDGATAEYAQFRWGPPKEWDGGTITFIPVWTGAAGAGGVTFRLSGVAISNDDAMDAAQGTPQDSDDTFIAANDLHVGPESSAITIAGTPADADVVVLEVSRNPADGNDTKTEDAVLLDVWVFFSTNAKNSA